MIGLLVSNQFQFAAQFETNSSSLLDNYISNVFFFNV